MKVLDRYIFKELLPPFCLGLFVFTFVMLTNIIIQLMDLFITKGIGLLMTLKLLFLSIPFLLVMTIPMSVLLAVLISFSRFSADSEIIALRASGISLHRFMPPVVVFALISYIATSIIYIAVLPKTNLMAKQLRYDIIRTKANIGIKPHVFNTDFIHLVIYVNKVFHETGELEGIFIADNRNMDKPIVIVAKRGYELLDPSQNSVKLRLENGCTHEIFKGDMRRYSLTPFQTLDLNLDMSFFQQETVSKSDREMTIAELLEKAYTNKNAGKNWNRQWVEIWKKTSLPFACLVFAFIGVPLGISTKRGGKSSGFAISIGLILIYYILLTGATGLAEEGKLPAFISTWLPNILLGVLGLFLYSKLANEKPIRFFESHLIRLHKLVSILINTLRNFGTKTTLKKPQWAVLFRAGRVLDRYIVRQYMKLLVYIQIALMSIALIIHAFEKIDNLVENNSSIRDSIIAIGFKLPYFGYLLLPFASLVAAILTVGLFSRTSELIAMKASGVSFIRITSPILILSFLISFSSFFLEETLIPFFNRRVEIAWDHIKKRERTRFIRYQRWYKGETGDIYFFQHFDPQKKLISAFSLFQIDAEMNILSRKECEDMIWTSSGWETSLSRTISMRPDCQVISDSEDSDFNVDIPETPEDFSKEHKDSEEMNIRELHEYIEILKQAGFDTVEYEVDWHAKISIPFLSFIMTLIGLGFAPQKARSSENLMGVGLSIFIGAFYFLIFRAGLELGQANKLFPFLSAWICNLVFSIIGWWILIRSNHH